MTKKKALIFPATSGFNSYIDLMVSGFESKSYEVSRFLGIKQEFRRLGLRCFKAYDVAYINWLEDILLNKSGKPTVSGGFSLMLYILFLKLVSKKQIYVRHNIYPHRTQQKYIPFVKKMINLIGRVFSVKATHSPGNTDRGYKYIPHPLYLVGDKPDSCESFYSYRSVASDFKPYLIFFGSISRYKGLHSLIESLRPDTNLIVAGFISDKEYFLELKSLAFGKNVIFINEKLSDREAAHLVSRATATILPHNSEEMIVSGSFFFSMSCLTPVVVLKNAFYDAIKSKMQDGAMLVLNDIKEVSNIDLSYFKKSTVTSSEFIRDLNFNWIDNLS